MSNSDCLLSRTTTLAPLLCPGPYTQQVDLGEVYSSIPHGVHRYRLRSMVSYSGARYQALVLASDPHGWLMIDDARVSRIGDWQLVRRMCEAGHIHPSVLFYEAA